MLPLLNANFYVGTKTIARTDPEKVKGKEENQNEYERISRMIFYLCPFEFVHQCLNAEVEKLPRIA